MMARRIDLTRSWLVRWAPTIVFASVLATIALIPTVLAPVARVIYAVCERIPVLSVITGHLPPLFLAFLVVLGFGLLITGGRAAATGLLATAHFNRSTDCLAAPMPARLAGLATRLRLDAHLSYLPQPEPMAFCYGLLFPRIAVTEGLLSILNDAELMAVLAHEREHLRRRDPLRYLIIDSLAAASCVLPVAWALRNRLEARIELSADRAALSMVPRAALAGALFTVLTAPAPTAPGVAGLSATEARIANLSGRTILPPLPARMVAPTLALAAFLVAVGASLALSTHAVTSSCVRCMGG